MIKSSSENIHSIISMKSHGAFQKYIDFIHFPFYRNMEINSRINFDFPLTAIVGQNGCGKSSVLHAIYGMPLGKTPYSFWFDTKIDPIIYYDDERRRHSFWYQYSDDSSTKQVIKARIKRGDNPNYWETSRPLVWANMTVTERESPIKKEVIYIDFRGELSAFDKFFYFGSYKNSSAKNKQEFIRNKSGDLKKAFSGNVRYSKTRALNMPVENLTIDELDAISYILGRKYESAKSLYHAYYRNDGYSVLFKTFADYSEAFAGSGEMAVVRLVSSVINAKDFSLIILDEPEVSLHPGAQRRLTEFLLEQIKKKKHQVVLTTHSPSLIQDLPKEAIKVLYQSHDNRFAVKENLIPEEAFYHLESENTDKIKVLFEDKLAKEIFNSVLKSLGAEKHQLFNLDYQPGGCSVLYKSFATIYCREIPSKNYIVLDGDQDQSILVEYTQLPTSELTSLNLRNLVKKKTRQDIVFAVDGNEGTGNEEQKIELYKKYIDYLNSHIFYLPLKIPEEIIWDSSVARNFLLQFSEENVEEVLIELESISDLKEKFVKLSGLILNDNSSNSIFYLQKMFINVWIKSKNDKYQFIVKIIDSILT